MDSLLMTNTLLFFLFILIGILCRKLDKLSYTLDRLERKING